MKVFLRFWSDQKTVNLDCSICSVVQSKEKYVDPEGCEGHLLDVYVDDTMFTSVVDVEVI